MQKPLQLSSENVLLNRLKGVSLSTTEFWCVHDGAGDTPADATTAHTSRPLAQPHDEHELYVKGRVAAWTKGVHDASQYKRRPPVICFTCNSPIRFAFFCPASFYMCPNPDRREQADEPLFDFNRPAKRAGDAVGVCLIDADSLRVYSSRGEDFRTSFPFAVSNAWQFADGLLLEKNASTSTLDVSHTMDMPRLYSLSHPLNDIFPVLVKALNGHVSFVTDASVKIAFVVAESNLVMIHDGKLGKHILCRLRKATHDEKQKVGVPEENDIFSSEFNLSTVDLGASSSVRFDGSGLSLRHKNRSGLDTSSLHGSKLKLFNNTSTHAHSLRARMSTSFDRSHLQSPYDRLQTSVDAHTTVHETEARIGYARPSRPIVPELCLESVWIESVGSRDFPDLAACGFQHCDFIGQQYICYLLKRAGALMLYRLEKSNAAGIPIMSQSSSIPARDAVCLKALHMIAIIAPCGMLNLYSGPLFVGKVDVGVSPIRQPTVSYPIPSTAYAMPPPSQFGPGPRRSSLLPSVRSAETSFDDELHLLSPVYPTQHQLNARAASSGCCSLRDVCGNRLTLQYSDELMFRLTLPPVSESPLVGKCLVALRHVLRKEIAITVIAKWYALRNTRGSEDISNENEWTAFYTFVLHSMGRTFGSARAFAAVASKSTSDEPKRRRTVTNEAAGTDDDFDYLLSYIGKVNGDAGEPKAAPADTRPRKRVDMRSILAPYMPIIFYAFHLLYEEMKLDESQKTLRSMLAELLFQLAMDLQLDQYCLHYFLDCPELVKMYRDSPIADIDHTVLVDKHVLSLPIPSVYQAIGSLYDSDHRKFQPYPLIAHVNPMSQRVMDLVALTLANGQIDGTYYVSTLAKAAKKRPQPELRAPLTADQIRVKALNHILDMHIERRELIRLPPTIHYIIAEVLEDCRINTPAGIPPRAYELIIRPDLYGNTVSGAVKETALQRPAAFKNENSLTARLQALPDAATNYDGMAHIHTKLLRLRFPKDLRIDEVRRILASSTPVTIDITQKVGVSDHEFIEERERFLLSTCARTMALPLGRGMLTMQTCKPSATDSFGIPKLCLTGREREKGSVIEMTTIELPASMNNWPLFHNGVAAGLQLGRDNKYIDSAWIVYNKLKSQQSGATIEHAGFLLGLGLNGHLKILTSMSLYDYLVKSDEMTNLAILIGISAANRGTMDLATTKALSIHIEALLPPTALELDVSQNVQVAAVMGIGLLYQGSAKRHIAEVLAQEIGRPPGPEMENCVERESYALTAGLALGLVTLGRGENSPGLADLKLPDMLHRYMVGGRKEALSGAQREKYRFQSFQVREGDTINTDVTAPGATLALGLMFHRTGNASVAAWMDPPDTHAVLDTVRPDLLLLRVLSRSLIMWDEIEPTIDWMFKQFPKWIQLDMYRSPVGENVAADPESFS